MPLGPALAQELATSLKFFKNTLSTFEPGDAGFAPKPEMFSVAAQVAHAAHTVDWFMEGAFGAGWDMDFEGANRQAHEARSLEDATADLERAYAAAIERISSAPDEELTRPIEDPSIMGAAPRRAVVSAIAEHTAHHRGSLAVYARLLGKVPVMPYS